MELPASNGNSNLINKNSHHMGTLCCSVKCKVKLVRFSWIYANDLVGMHLVLCCHWSHNKSSRQCMQTSSFVLRWFVDFAPHGIIGIRNSMMESSFQGNSGTLLTYFPIFQSSLNRGPSHLQLGKL